MTESSSPAERPVQFLFVCLSRRAEGPPATTMTEDETRKEHRAYLQDLHDRGLLCGSGPQRDSSGNDTGGAVHILQNVDDIETARDCCPGAVHPRRLPHAGGLPLAPRLVRAVRAR